MGRLARTIALGESMLLDAEGTPASLCALPVSLRESVAGVEALRAGKRRRIE